VDFTVIFSLDWALYPASPLRVWIDCIFHPVAFAPLLELNFRARNETAYFVFAIIAQYFCSVRLLFF